MTSLDLPGATIPAIRSGSHTIQTATPVAHRVDDRDVATEDAGWLVAAASGDDQSLLLLYRRHVGGCLAHARALLRDQHLAEEAVQDAFLDLWRSAGAFDSVRCSVAGWLHTLVHRRAVDAARSSARRQAHSQCFPDELVDGGPDPADAALTAALGRAALDQLRELPMPQRRALVLAYWGGYTMTEIAALEGAPVGTVKTRCRAGLSRLREAMAAA
ncbi:MAG: polymerase, sigma-24 subunit, subfamily [Frankiales bacterium]|nr:polymerase, sigma-24 subunit, subfamily [Frankiales bacterium]